MTVSEFNDYWKTNYPEAHPIGYELRHIYPKRWFRIHSLPESKRYAESEEEYQIIFNRQNKLIEDVIGNGSEIFILFGLYNFDATNDNYTELTDFGEFEKTQTIDLQKEGLEEDKTLFDIYVKCDKWETNNKNEILKAIADDKIRALFVCPLSKNIVIPYDGGMDLILNSEEERDQLKLKYKGWLSTREDGM